MADNIAATQNDTHRTPPGWRRVQMLSKYVFTMAHEAGNLNFYPTYKKLVQNQWRRPEELLAEQEMQLRHMVGFAYQNVPYYHKLFNRLGLKPDDIRTVRDLDKLPFLNKEIINKNPDDFRPLHLRRIKHTTAASGGSTGTPLQYRLSNYDRFLGGALLYRGWGYGGYQLGDRMVFLAGSSLDVNTRSVLATRAHEVARNIKKLSAFSMGDKEMQQYACVINSFKPEYLRGYASSLYFFACWLEKNDVKIESPKGVFTTAEKLYPLMRKKLSAVFNCPVYDTYGLNDGGISAYECEEHAGLHIDTERGVLEVVDDKGDQIGSGEGRIIATSLHNYAMPFLRYDTGDGGHLLEEPCACGRGYKLLKCVNGRTVGVLLTPEGLSVHGEFFSHIFWDLHGVKEYQIIQETLEQIVIKIVPDGEFDERQLDRIRRIVATRSAGWKLEFKIVDQIERTGAGKYKFVVNKYIDSIA